MTTNNISEIIFFCLLAWTNIRADENALVRVQILTEDYIQAQKNI